MNNKGFTLVEIVVAITIFMIVLISVMQIFGISVNLSNKIDINRQVQENVKNVTETIKEDIRKYGINGVKNSKIDSYELSDNTIIKKGVLLKLGENKYYLSVDDTNFIALDKDEIDNICNELKNNCFLVKDDGIYKSKLTNSWVAFENIEFVLIGDKIKKLVIKFTMRPSSKKGINSNLIKSSKLIFQTTISERFVKTN